MRKPSSRKFTGGLRAVKFGAKSNIAFSTDLPDLFNKRAGMKKSGGHEGQKILQARARKKMLAVQERKKRRGY